MTTHTPAKIKPGWKMPQAPDCCGQPMVPKAWLRFGERWFIAWDCLCCNQLDDTLNYYGWPFDYGIDLTAKDFELAGFEVQS